MPDVITEVRLNRTHMLNVSLNNGLDIKCPDCDRVTEHTLATPESVRCVVCRRLVKLIWV